MKTSCGYRSPTQYIIDTGKSEIFQSYDTIVAKREKGITYLDKNHWAHSYTSARYRNRFLDENIQETRKKIINGTYKLVDLNKE